MNCKILYGNDAILKNSFSIAQKYRLLTNDAHIAASAQSNALVNIASNDKDFLRIPWLSVWKPQSDNIGYSHP
jgi:predicted nucleic acid-binding protein